MKKQSRQRSHNRYNKHLKRVAYYIWVVCVVAWAFNSEATAQTLEQTVLEPGRTLERQITSEQKHLYPVYLRAGEFLQVRINQKGIDLWVGVYTTRAETLAEIDTTERDGLEILSFIPQRDGLYGILVGRMGGEGNPTAGRYSIVFTAGRLATARDRQQVEAERQFASVRKTESRFVVNVRPLIEKYERLMSAYRGVADEHLVGLIEGRIKFLKEYEASLAEGAARGAVWRRQMEEEVAMRRAAEDRQRAKELSNANLPQLIVPTGHSNGVSSVAFSPNGRILASGSVDNTIKLWDADTGQELRTLSGHDRYIFSVAFSPDGRILASGAGDATVKLWDTTSGQLLRTLTGHSRDVFSVAFSSDGRTLASGGLDLTIKLWDINTGQELRTVTGHSGMVTSVAFSPDGRTLASAASDKTVMVWDVQSGQVMHTLPGISEQMGFKLAISPDGRILASGGENNTIKLWDLASGKLRRTLYGHSDHVTEVVFSPDGRLFASKSSADKKIKIWDTKKWSELYSFSDSPASMAFSPDGHILATGGGIANVKLWNIDTGLELRTLSKPPARIWETVFSPDGRILAIGGTPKAVYLWDKTSGRFQTLTGHSAPVFSLAFSPDGRILASGSEDKTIKLWELNTGRVLCTLTGHTTPVDPLTFSPDGRTLASVGEDKIIRLWDTSTCWGLRTFNGHPDVIRAVAFSPDGRTLASGSEDKTIKLWSLNTNQEIRTLKGHSNSVISLAFSPDGRTLASGSSDYTVKLWDAAVGQELRTFKGHSSRVISVGFSSDGRALVSKSGNSIAKLWDVNTGQEIKWDKSIQWNTRILKELISTPSGKLIRADTEGPSVILRDTVTEDECARLVAFDENDWLVTTPEGFFDGTNKAWQRLRWRFNNNTFDTSTVDAYFSDFFYPNLLQEVFNGKTPMPPNGRELDKLDRRQPQVKITANNGQVNAQSNNSTATDRRVVTVVVEVADNPDKKRQPSHQQTSGAQDLRLFRNGSLVKVWRSDVFRLNEKDGCQQVTPTERNEARRVRCQAEVPIVAGDNNFTAYVFNSSNVKSNDDTVTIKGADSLKRAGTLYVLTIGVGQYGNPQYNLNYTVADAKGFGEEIKRRQEQLKQYEQVEVINLLNEQAKKSNILAELQRLAATVQPEDGVIIFFSGHGTAQGNSFYLIPHDLGYQGERNKLNERSLRTILAHSISDRELEEAFEKIDAGQLLLVIDACNSGQALDAEEKRRGPMNSKGLAQLAYEKGMYVLTASQSVELAFESEALKHSYLTYALVEEGLKSRVKETDANGDGQVWLREWFDYTVQRVPRMREERIEQTAKQQNKSLEVVEIAERGKVQTPRVFYRREADTQPWIVAQLR